MKPTAIFLVSLTIAGCSSLPGILEKGIPDGKWKEVDATVNGKFSSTTIKGTNVSKDGKTITAGDLYIRHSNTWMPLVEFRGTGFLAPSAPQSSPP